MSVKSRECLVALTTMIALPVLLALAVTLIGVLDAAVALGGENVARLEQGIREWGNWTVAAR